MPPLYPRVSLNSMRSSTQCWHQIKVNGYLPVWSKNNEERASPMEQDNTIDISYTDEEYEMYYKNDNWTREETDHLVELCGIYTYSTLVIHDRWELVPDRSIEDIKERIYFIYNHKVNNRGLPSIVYSKEQDTAHRKNLEVLYNRSPDVVREEESYIDFIKGIKRRQKEHRKKEGRLITKARRILKNQYDKNDWLYIDGEYKYEEEINSTLKDMNIKPSNNVTLLKKFNKLRESIDLVFQLQELQAEAAYEYDVLLEMKQSYITSKRKRMGLRAKDYQGLRSKDGQILRSKDQVHRSKDSYDSGYRSKDQFI
eukprot:TRINITY_DN5735_c0_g1_i1.p1 TRINITY_DN5735_c0_g1~~TRINITY_DN5735_c0_g1_i1.p1  ORF type:complete len:331 (+),score=63.15 TRINITY_DN5735_c0_g1_i1:58-993(+)